MTKVYKTKKAITLIEILLYCALLCTFIVLISAFLWDVSATKIKNDSQAEVSDNAAIVMNEIARSIRNASSVVTPAAVGSSATTLVLSMPNSGQNAFDLVDGRLRFTSSTAQRINLDVMLVIDVSGSMSGQPLISEKAAASSFVDQLDTNYDQVGVVSFSSSATLRQSLTTNYATAKSVINNLAAGGTTNYQDGIQKSTSELNGTNHRPGAKKVMVFMSDGIPNVCNDSGCNPTNSAKAASDAAKAAAIENFSIGLIQSISTSQLPSARAILQYIASSSSGTTDHYFEAPTDSDLLAIYNQIAFLLTATGARNITSSIVSSDLDSVSFTNVSHDENGGAVRIQMKITRVNVSGNTEYNSSVIIDDTISLRPNQ